MDTQELKKLLKGSTAVLILENGEPSFVILGYDAYKGLVSEQEKEVKINRLATELPDADVETPSRPVSSETAAQPRPFKKERGQRGSALGAGRPIPAQGRRKRVGTFGKDK